jgi:arylsulfatase A-like enzyme
MIQRWSVVLLALCACGKSNKDTTPEGKVSETAPAAPNSASGVALSNNPAKPAEPAAKAPAHNDHPVYSLVDNRLSAHLTRGGGLVVPAGSAGFAKYLRIGNVMHGWKRTWELRQTEDNIKVARMTGKAASVFVPLSAPQVGRATVRLRVWSKGDNALSLKVNENKDINSKIEKGWSTVEVTVPAGQLREGENALGLYMKSSGAELAWIQVGATTPVGDDGQVTFFDAGKKALVVPKGGAMSWYVMVPEQARLTADVDGTCQVGVRATADDGTSSEGKLVGNGAVDLSSLADKPVRLDLEPVDCDATIANAALVVQGAAPQIKRGDAPKYVVFMIMDALRADRVHAFNPKTKVDAPNFDRLAESSALFLQTYSPGNESQVSHASIWSSAYLPKHKAMEMKDILADRWVTIDKVAKKAGMYVAGASGNGYIRPERGFGTGWNRFVNHIEKGLGLKGADIVDKAMSFVEPKKTQPWFAYMGLIDTHVTWRAKKPWIDKYDGGYKGRFAVEYGDDGPNGSDGKDLTEKEHDHVRALYDSNVSYQDDLVGKLIEKLQAWGVWDQTMLIITADHGDELWEDGRVGHGASERETLVHVPLVIHYPPMFPAAKVTEGVEGIDIVPTIADALGVAQDPEWQGTSLIPVANGAVGYPLLSFSSQYESFHAGRIASWKAKLMGTGAPHLYNLARDPDERKDLSGQASAEIPERMLIDPMWLLRQWNVEWKKAVWGNPANVSSRFAADLGE